MQSADVYAALQLTLQSRLQGHTVTWYAAAAGDDESLHLNEIADGTVLLHHGVVEPGDALGTDADGYFERFSATCIYGRVGIDPYGHLAKGLAMKVAAALSHARFGYTDLGTAEITRISERGDFNIDLDDKSIHTVEWQHHMLIHALEAP